MAKGPMTDHQKLIAARSAMKALRKKIKRMEAANSRLIAACREVADAVREFTYPDYDEEPSYHLTYVRART